MALGVTVQTRTAPSARGAPTDTGTAFLVGKMTAGPTIATLVTSLADFVVAFGARGATGNTVCFDWVDTFFREGGQRVYVARGTTAALALALLPPTLGPGQVASPEETAGAPAYAVLLDHAAANNRFALMDAGATDTVAASVTLGGLIPVSNESYGALFGPFVTVPAPAGTVGAATRSVAPSAVVAALCNRADALGNPNRAPAGRDFPLQYAIGYAADRTLAEIDTLLNAGVNSFATIFGVLELYGFQTGMASNQDNPFWQANCGRARMWLVANAQEIGEGFMFKPIDGKGHLAAALKQALSGVALDLYNVDGLYGETPADAYAIEVGSQINTVTNIAQGVLSAVLEARLTPHAKSVIIDLVSVPVTGRVSQ